MTSSSKSTRAAALALFVGLVLGAGSAAAGEIHVLLGVDPADASGDVLLSASLAPAQSLTRATGSRTTIAQTSTMAEVMRASRTVENEIIIAPAHVTASAILHAYQLLATSGQEQTYALVVRNDIDKVEKLAGKRLYLPQQDSLRSYMAKGLLTESGVKLGQFSKVTYGNTSGGGLVALSFDMADVTVADETQAKEWITQHPGQARILKTTRPVPGGMNMVVRKDFCATECGRLGDWVNSPDGAIPGVGRFRMASADADAAVHLRRLARHRDARGRSTASPGSARSRSPSSASRARRSSTRARRRNTTTSTSAAPCSRRTSRRA